MRTLVFSLAVIGFLSDAAGARAADLPLTGKMAWWQQVLGRWNCSLRLYPVAGQPNGTGAEQLIVESAPANTVHQTVSVGDYRGGGYVGYDETTRKWWEADVDNNGFSTLSASSDGILYTVVSNAGTMKDRKNDVFRVRYSLNNGVFVEHQEWLTKGRWVRSSVDTCNRVP